MLTGSVIPAAIFLAGGWPEAVFAAIMAAPLLFFLACAFYLWRLLLSAIQMRSRLRVLAPIEITKDALEKERSVRPDVTGASAQFSPQTEMSTEPPDFVVLIPAHNEELVVGAALKALRNLEYPESHYRIVVIADNCTDQTAVIARQQGATVLVREDKVSVGKGYALGWALEQLTREEAVRPADDREGVHAAHGPAEPSHQGRPFDAVVIIDADTLVAPNLLRAFSERLMAGDLVLQARYEVLNVHESWRTRLMSCALALAHIVKPMGRERLKLSDGLKGNGMCFARSIVDTVPWSGESITEDIDYTIRVCRAGHRVGFVPETAVWAQMPTTGKQSASQRKRWEGGRYQLIFHVAPALFTEGIRRRSAVQIDRAIDLMIPPFAEMFAAPLLLFCVSLIAMVTLRWRSGEIFSVAWCLVLLLQAGYLFVGMWAARIPMAVALTALYAPGYILWKFGLYIGMMLQRSAGGWMRTERRKIGG